MFDKSTQNSSKGMSNEESMAISGVAIIGGLGFMFNKNLDKIELWYFNHFEEIYLILFGLIATFCIYLIYLIEKKTKNLKARSRLLSPFWRNGLSNIEVGKTEDAIDLHLSNKSRTSHVQVIGTTGAGKTESVVIPWSVRDLERGNSVVVIDGKGSSDLPYEIFSAIDKRGIDCEKFHFDLGNPIDSIKINPLMHGSAQQITDRIFSSFEFSDSFYEAVQYDICGYLTRLIHETESVITFKLLYKLLTDDTELSKLISELSDESDLKQTLRAYLRESVKDRRAKTAGLASQLSPFATSEIAEIVNATSDKDSLSELMLNSFKTKVFIFSIPTLKYQALGHKLGKLILQELAWCVGEREQNEGNKFTSVFLDEFSEFVYAGFISILNKARSANVGMHLCHQSLSDLTSVSESFARSINTNTNVKCILGLNDPDTADFFARHLGTHTNMKYTEQTEANGLFNKKTETGKGSAREVESYKVHPNELKSFSNGLGVLHFSSPLGLITEKVQFKRLGGEFG